MAVPKSSRLGNNIIAVFESIAPNAGVAITVTSSGHSQLAATSSGHSQPTVNTCHNLDIHDAASLPLLAILGNENVSVYSSSEDDSSMFIISTTKKITSRNKKKTIIIKGQLEGVLKEEMGQLEGILKEEMQQIWTVNHHLDAFLLLPHW